MMQSLTDIIVKVKNVEVGKDRNSGAKSSITYYGVPKGYIGFGHMCTPGLIFAVKASSMPQSGSTRHGKPLVRVCDEFEMVWSDKGSGKKKNYTVWIPKAPRGYVALGAVLELNSKKRDPSERFLCVREDMTRVSRIRREVWNTKGVGGKINASFGMTSALYVWPIKTSYSKYNELDHKPREFDFEA